MVLYLWDMSSHLNALAESETEGKGKYGTSPILNQAPLVNFSGHKDEGYALDSGAEAALQLNCVLTVTVSFRLNILSFQ